MSFGNIIGQLLQQGMAGQNQTRDRLQNAANQSGGGMEQMLGSLLGGGGGSASGPRGSAGGIADLAKQFLGNKQVGGMTGAQAGGLGALVGAVLGGGGGAAKGAVGGGAMAILGTLALTALKNYQAGATGAAAAAPMGEAAPVAPEEVQALTDPATERLVLRAMISAAKADGQVDQKEMQAIAGKISGDGVTDAERQFVIEEMTRPLDVHALAAEVNSPAVAAEIYAASILAIDIDSEAERQYLRDLARATGLDAGTVQRLHQLTGAPAI
jgi:uncharacterized membrane protein YebE (DUF533 family)